MNRYFNTEGQCDPMMHYMVRLDDRVDEIKRRFVDPGKYFVINKGRQYGKTTTLYALEEYLRGSYIVAFMDFQEISTAEYRDEFTFTRTFLRLLAEALQESGIDTDGLKQAAADVGEGRQMTLGEMFGLLSQLCGEAPRPVVLMADEVDHGGNYQVFLDFLALLRSYYLKRRKKPTFHSVILAGVYDIKNLKLKIRPEEEHQYNSPWNIAAEFDVVMDLSTVQIRNMLEEYETDHRTGMATAAVAEEIYRYTSGYPYLVSAICKILDERLPENEGYGDKGSVWTKEGVGAAAAIILKTKIPLFDSMVRQLDLYPMMRELLEQILYEGRRISFSPDTKSINIGLMFGFLKEKDGYVVISNRIFEMRLMNLFITRESVRSDVYKQGQSDRNQFVRDGRLDMERVLEKFVEYFQEIYGDNDEKFIEKYGRKFFLLYLKPIINGTGNYYLEAQTRDGNRTDVIVDYRGERFVVEMKIWRGNEYNERGEEQLAGYLEYFHQKKGYMLSFNFNKKKETGIKTIMLGDKVLVEAVV